MPRFSRARYDDRMPENPYEPPRDTRDWRGYLARLLGASRRQAKCAFCGEPKSPLVEGVGTAAKGVLICRECAQIAVDLLDEEIRPRAPFGDET